MKAKHAFNIDARQECDNNFSGNIYSRPLQMNRMRPKKNNDDGNDTEGTSFRSF